MNGARRPLYGVSAASDGGAYASSPAPATTPSALSFVTHALAATQEWRQPAAYIRYKEKTADELWDLCEYEMDSEDEVRLS